MKFLLLLILLPISLFSQEILIDEMVEDTILDNQGPNRQNFSHNYLSFSFPITNTENNLMKIVPIASYQFEFGMKYKRKLNSYLAFGGDFFYNRTRYKIEQDSSKVFPDTLQFDKQKLALNNLGADVFLRLNLGKRGNIVGKYLDLGFYGEWIYKGKFLSKNKQDKLINTEEYINPSYLNRLNYGAKIEIGFNQFAFVGKYRMSDLFTQTNQPLMPKFMLGLQIGVFK